MGTVGKTWYPVCGTCVGAAMLQCSHDGGGFPVLIQLSDLERLQRGVSAHVQLVDGRLVVTPTKGQP